ncbi:MAG: M23 family metallopeptidase [Clostridia bacterium]|nr:M23 family metallopeptidase [Clostridia bacterium]
MKRIKNQEKIKKTIYSVSALALCGVTLFSIWFSNKDNNITPQESDTTITTTEQTTEDIEVNTPVENVRDDRTDPITTTEETPISVFYSFPLGNKVAREYSKGEIVKNKTTDDWRTHNGVDINGAEGDQVNAICDGTVTELEHSEIWGTIITINHGNGFTAKYYGLQKDGVAQPGEEIKANSKIGVLGEIPIESADGIHLHFELYKDGVTVSPSDYLGKRVDI